MIKAIAIDDEPPALRIIEHFCAETEGVELLKTFTNPEEAKRYIVRFPVDLIFLDVQMPSVNGLQFFNSLPHKPMLILTTAFSEYAVEGFNVNAVDYLLKPYTPDRFDQAIAKIKELYALKQDKMTPDSTIFLRADYGLVKIHPADILYIEGFDDYLKIHYGDGQTVVIRMTLKSILSKLSPTEFLRIHRSFIVPISRVERIRNKAVTIGEIEIPIGGAYEEDFKRVFGKEANKLL